MRESRLIIQGGYMVAIEGIDAAGKSTQSLLLSDWLRRRKKVKTVMMSFPDYDTPIGKEIKSFLSGRRTYPTELQHLLFAANRWEKSQEIESHLRAGNTIIVNRYTESNLAYGRANGLDIDWLANLENGLPKANLVIILDAPIRSLSSRRSGSNKDTYEKKASLQNRARNAYRELASKNGWRIIDANRSVQDVESSVRTTVKEALARDKGTVL